MHAATQLRSIVEGRMVRGAIPLELMPADRILQRWASAGGTGMPSDSWDDSPAARPPPLDDVTATLVELIVNARPRRERQLIRTWYRSPASTCEIARRMRTSLTGIKNEMTVALCRVSVAFMDAPNPTLVRLMRARA